MAASGLSVPNAFTISSTDPTSYISAAIAGAILSASTFAILATPSLSASTLRSLPEKSAGQGESAIISPTHPRTRAYSTLSHGLSAPTSPGGIVPPPTTLGSQGLGFVILSAFGDASKAVESLASPDLDSVVGKQAPVSGSEYMFGDISISATASTASAADVNQYANSEHGEQTLITVFPSATSAFVPGSQRLTFDVSSRLKIGSQTLIPGAAPITIFGSTYSLAPYASVMVIDGVTVHLLSIAEKESSISDSIVSLNNGSLRPVPSSTRSQIIIGSQTLIPGASPVIISRVTVSLPSSGDNVVIGQNTLTLPESHHNASNTSSVGSGTTNNVTIPSPTRSLHTDTTLPGPATASSSQTGHGKRLDLGAWRSITTSRLAGFATVALI